ncbi:HAD family hydrolase [Micromonospora ureilytica]|uniref:HAD family hydrolase n=1 Tax=Micromonospora ureilytica TaxID=709868 RepID=UPI00403A04B8
MLTTVVFDADETLLDLRPAVTGGLVAVLDEMRRAALARSLGLPKKPAPEFYGAVVAAAGVPAGQIVYVGDSWEHDVVAPRRAGLRSVWLNRLGLPRPLGCTPDAEVSSMADLPTALADLGVGVAGVRLELEEFTAITGA